MSDAAEAIAIEVPPTEQTALRVLGALSFSHLLNDTIQMLLPAIYPILKFSYQFSFAQIGLITLTYQMVASLLQPLIGMITDRRPMPYSLAIGMASTLVGLVLLAAAGTLPLIIGSAALIGIGSAVFHPEASRIAHLAAGGRHGFAQSLFQVGGNFGTSLGPLLAAWIIVPNGQKSIAWFSLLAFVAIVLLVRIGGWYQAKLRSMVARPKPLPHANAPTAKHVAFSLAILLVLVLSKYCYLVSFSNYYTFYLINKFHVSIQASQIYMFVFLFGITAGTLIGGPMGDRFGRKLVICVSVLGVAPFSLVLPYANLPVTVALSFFAGLVLASTFPAIIVFAQELMPGKVGTVAGMFFGFAFGITGIASALLGELADRTSLNFVFQLCSYLPLLGIFAVFLPNLDKRSR
jgi:FSR family fosmidomycin resistance protein-like MFS transporter